MDFSDVLLIIAGVIVTALCVKVIVVDGKRYLQRNDKLREFCENAGLNVNGATAYAMLTAAQTYVKKRCGEAREEFCVNRQIISGCVNTYSSLGICAVSKHTFFYDIKTAESKILSADITGVTRKKNIMYVKMGAQRLSVNDFLFEAYEVLENAKNISCKEIPLLNLMYFSAKYNSKKADSSQTDVRSALKSVTNSIAICVNDGSGDKLYSFEVGDINTAVRVLRKMLPGKEFK